MNRILPLDTDILNTNRFGMVGLGMALKAILGDGPNVDGLACSPGTGLTVNIGPGAIYSIDVVDAYAYANLPADTADQIVKQGLTWGQTEVGPLAAPVDAGQSVVWLIEAQFQEIDGAPVNVPYYNQANNAPQWVAVNTVRQGVCVLQAKQGVVAPAGTQLVPVADAGWTPLYAVTVVYGATSVLAADIAVATGAPFIATKLPQAAPIDSPVFTGAPTVPTPAYGDNSTQAVNTAWIRQRLLEILDSPAFTGTPTAPTPAAGDDSTQLATTAWIRLRLAELLDSPAFTGIPTTPTPAAGDSSTQVANTEWVKQRLAEILDSPAFTGTPTAPTPAAGDDSTQLATTAWIRDRLTEILDSPAFTGIPTVPTPAAGDSSTQIANTAWVEGRLAGINAPTYIDAEIAAAMNAAGSTLDGGEYVFDTSSAAFTVNLPASPARGKTLTLMDLSNTWSLHNAILGRNGKNIMGLAQDLALNIADAVFTIWYNGTEWRLI